MSQHIFETEHKGEKVRVLAGWDSPLQGFFMVIEKINTSDDDDVYIYSNLDEEDFNPRTFEPFIRVLVDLGIVIPKEMIEEIIEDGKLNVGNKEVEHGYNNGQYTRKQLYPVPQKPTEGIPFKNGSPSPLFIPVWNPLKQVVGEPHFKRFMFMASYEIEDGTIIHTYKHADYRSYINISDDLRTWEYTGIGYKEISREEALSAISG